MDEDKYWYKNNVAYVIEAPAVISPPPPIVKPAIMIVDLSKDEKADDNAYKDRTAHPLRDLPPWYQPVNN